MVDDKEAMERERIRINDDIKRTEYNESFLHGEEVIAKARSRQISIDKHDLSYLMRQDLVHSVKKPPKFVIMPNGKG